MLEIFNSDLDKRILKEVHHATQIFKKSTLEIDAAGGSDGISG